MPKIQIPPDLLIKSESEPQLKILFKNLLEGFVEAYPNLDLKPTLIEFLLEQARKLATQIKKAENDLKIEFKGKHKQALYFQAGYFLSRLYEEYPAIRFTDILADFKFVRMPPSNIEFDLLQHEGNQFEPPNALTAPLNIGYYNTDIRSSTFLFYNNLDHSLTGIILRIGFNEDFLVRQGYVKPPRES